MTDIEQYSASERIGQIISSVLIGYRLAIRGGTPVESMPWHRDETLPRYSVLVSTPDDSIVYTALVWAGRDDELEEHLRRWLLERIHLEGTKRGHGRRPDPWRVRMWEKACPGCPDRTRPRGLAGVRVEPGCAGLIHAVRGRRAATIAK